MTTQIVGDRREDVRFGRPDVPAAILVEVDGPRQIAGRKELRLAHGARPRSLQLVVLHVAGVENGERIEQLTAKQATAPIVVGERGQRGDDRAYAVESSEVRFESPDRDLDARLDAVGGGYALGEARTVLETVSRRADGLGREAPPQIGRQIEREFRLLPIAFEDDVHGLETGQRDVER